MILVITMISIFGITGFFLLANKILPVRICPVCAGVSGTWIWILAGMYFGALDAGSWQLVAGILMGGSVVGIAYQVEKRLHIEFDGWRILLLWKTLFISAGFVFMYSVLMQWWSTVFVFFVFLLLISFIFLFPKRRARDNKIIEELEKKMKDCC